MRTTKKRIRRIVTGMICLLLMFTLTGCLIKIDKPGLGQIRQGDSFFVFDFFLSVQQQA